MCVCVCVCVLRYMKRYVCNGVARVVCVYVGVCGYSRMT